MKKGFVYKITWAVLVMFGLFAASCNKDLRVDVKDVKIINEHIDTTTISAKITGEYVFPSVLKGIDVYLSDQENMNNAKVYSAVIENHQFSVEINELVGRTKYFYCYEFNNGMDKACSEVRSFRTAEYADAEIITEVKESSIKATTALVGGVIISTNGYDVVKCGLCWTKSAGLNPDINAMPHWDTIGITIGHFDKRIIDLSPNTSYYVWAYFISSKDYKPVYGQRETFKTKEGKIELNLSVQQPDLGKALCNYDIYTDFSSPISEHGICWSSAYSDPTPEHCEGKLLGEGDYTHGFSAIITGLIAGKEYHVRAYATNEIKPWYSDTKSFTAFTGIPVFSDFKVTKIRGTSMHLTARVHNGGDNAIDFASRGFLWSKSNTNPKIGNCDGNRECQANQYDYISLDLDGLETEQLYHVRSYAQYDRDTYEYGEVKHITTTKLGGLTGVFTINNSGDKVCFSQSNLQYKNQQWWFDDEQYAMVETNGQNVGVNYANQDVISLFGWGTSGHNHNNGCYYPWSTNPDYTKYWAYGTQYANLFDNDGTADWGHNRIHTDWTTVIPEPEPGDKGWHTLEKGEWSSLIGKCNDAGRFSSGRIEVTAGVYNNGFILLPDNWTLPEGLHFMPKVLTWSNNPNTYSKDEWNEMEAAGAVFLPVAGVRYKENGSPEVTNVTSCNQTGYYWSSTMFGPDKARCIVFDLYKENGFESKEAYKILGYSVRLVHDL